MLIFRSNCFIFYSRFNDQLFLFDSLIIEFNKLHLNEYFNIYPNIVGPISNCKKHSKKLNIKLKPTKFSSVWSPSTAALGIVKEFSKMKHKKEWNIVCLLTAFNGKIQGNDKTHISVGIFRKVNEPGSVIECE